MLARLSYFFSWYIEVVIEVEIEVVEGDRVIELEGAERDRGGRRR
jgi:hypothetical protein